MPMHALTSPCGAGLLAKAVCQATMMSPVTPSSRASPLPQGLCLTDCCRLHLNLRAQFDHAIEWQLEVFEVAVGVLQQKCE